AAVALLMAWCGGSRNISTATVGVAFALACLTRYEAWPVMWTALVAAVWVRWRQGTSFPDAIRAVIGIAIYPAAAIAGFFVFSRIVTGVWFADDFFVPENTAKGHPYDALKEIAWGVRELTGFVLLMIAFAVSALLAAFC